MSDPKPKYPWYMKALDLPGAIVFLMLMGLLVAYIKASGTPRVPKENEYHRITLKLLPFVLAIGTLVAGYSATNPTILKALCALAIICVVFLALKVFQFVHNPLGWLDHFILSALKSKKRLAPELLVKPLGNLEPTAPGQPGKVPQTTIIIIEMAKALLKMTGSPRIPLAMFFVYYVCATVLTIGLFGLLIKSFVLGTGGYDAYDFFLASVLRFTAASSLTEVFGNLTISPTLLAFESCMSCYYLVIAILAFGVIANHSAEELEEKMKPLYEREMKALGINDPLLLEKPELLHKLDLKK